MAEPVVSSDQENKHVINNGPSEKHETDEEENEDLLETTTNASLLPGLNLVLILSFLSLSPEDVQHLDEAMQEIQTGENDHKATKHGSCSRRREIGHFPAVGRQSAKVHTKIRDIRHCRRF